MENRKKFMQTCVPHLTCMLTFMSTVVFDIMYMRFGSKNIAPSLQNFIAIEFLIISPIMNPLIWIQIDQSFYPKFLLDLLSSSHVISYNGCLMQAFVMFSFACSDLSILSVMAYDRYLAICRPLRYHRYMNKLRLSLLVCFSWLIPFSFHAVLITLTSRLTLCSAQIQRLYCVNWVIVLLACPTNNTTPSSIVVYITVVVYVFHGLLIIWSYIYLVRTCRGSIENRKKFMQTCVPHLTCMLTFMSTVVFDIMYMHFGSKNIAQSLKNLISMVFMIISPIMNPLIYGFKLTKGTRSTSPRLRDLRHTGVEWERLLHSLSPPVALQVLTFRAPIPIQIVGNLGSLLFSIWG
ncbi:unnamed protein product [Gadus morhua 'NCC']